MKFNFKECYNTKLAKLKKDCAKKTLKPDKNGWIPIESAPKNKQISVLIQKPRAYADGARKRTECIWQIGRAHV